MKPLISMLVFCLLASRLALADPAPAPAVRDPYVRQRTDGPGKRTLEVAARRFVLAGQPDVWLVGAVHIGEAAYYATVQKLLDAQDVVLFESVGRPEFMDLPRDADDHRAAYTRKGIEEAIAQATWYRNSFMNLPATVETLAKAQVRNRRSIEVAWLRAATTDGWGRSLSWQVDGDKLCLSSLGADGQPGGTAAAADIVVTTDFTGKPFACLKEFSLQRNLAHALGLEFQLDDIRYDQARFHSCDMTARQMTDAIRAIDQQTAAADPPGTTGTTGSGERKLDQLMQVMRGGSFSGNLVKISLQILQMSPKSQVAIKYMLAEMLAMAGADLEKVVAQDEATRKLMQAILHERNQVVLAGIRAIVAKAPVPASVAVFYGAAHMDAIEQALVDDLGYAPAETRWFNAFSVDLAAANMQEADFAFFRAMIDAQKQKLQPPPPKK
jgi:hypothetical protein